MTARLHRRDPAVKYGWRIALCCLWFGYLWSIVLEKSGALTSVDLGACWVLYLVLPIVAPFWIRGTPFELALPIPARTLWLRRTAPLLGFTLGFVALTTLAAVIFGAPPAAALRTGAHVGGGMALLLAILMSINPRRNVAATAKYVIPLTAISAAGMMWVTQQMLPLPAGYAAGTLLAAVVVLASTYLRTPEGYRLVPDKAAASRRRPEQAVSRAGEQTRRPLWLLIPRILFNWEWWLVFAMEFLLATMPGSERLVLLVVMVLPVSLLFVLQRMTLLVSLPVSRQLIFACAALPGVAFWAAGSLVGRLIWGSAGELTTLLVYQPGGPESVEWFRFTVDTNMWALFAIVAGLVWTAGYLVMFLRGMRPGWAGLSPRWTKILGGGAAYVYGAVVVGMLWLTMERAPLLSGFHAAARYHLGRWATELVAVLPEWRLVAWMWAGLVLFVLFRLLGARFARLEVTGIPEMQE